MQRTTWNRRNGNWEKVEDRVDWSHMTDPSGLVLGVGLVTVFHRPAMPKSAEVGPGGLHRDSKVVDIKSLLKELRSSILRYQDSVVGKALAACREPQKRRSIQETMRRGSEYGILLWEEFLVLPGPKARARSRRSFMSSPTCPLRRSVKPVCETEERMPRIARLSH